jgi:hypothetical protein
MDGEWSVEFQTQSLIFSLQSRLVFGWPSTEGRILPDTVHNQQPVWICSLSTEAWIVETESPQRECIAMNPATLIVLVVLLAVSSVIGGLILRASISLFNRLFAKNHAQATIQEPSVGKAIGITLATLIVNAGAGLLIGTLLGGGAQLAGRGPSYPKVAAGTVSSVLAILSMVVMLALLLPTSLVRAFVVTLFNYLICFAIALFLGAIASLFFVVA